MRIPTLLFLTSLAVAAFSGTNAGAMTDLSLLAGVSAVAALILMLANEPEAPTRDIRGREVRAPQRAGRRSGEKRMVLVDGSNVLWWRDGAASIDTLRAVVRVLRAQGMVPLVGFDANVGYVVSDSWRDARAMARMLGLPASQVSVAPKGTPADPLLIAEALRLDAPIVTNDRYREWLATWPQIAAPGFLIQGCFAEGALVLNLPEFGAVSGGLPLAA